MRPSFLSPSSLNSPSFSDVYNKVSANPTVVPPGCSGFPALLSSLHRLQKLAYHHIPPPWGVLHESRYPHMCRNADPVNTSRFGRPSRFNRYSLVRRGVDCICTVPRCASQLTHGIDRKKCGGGGCLGREERKVREEERKITVSEAHL